MDALHLEPGQVVQGQTLVERLGAGGFGEVWKAQYYGQTVAVKFFQRGGRLEGTRRESIAQYVLGRIKPEDGGRFFPRVEHFDLDASPPYMRMECLEGKSLDHWFTKQPQMELGRALRVAEDLLSALVVVHDMGFVHGDLSASNVIVGTDDKVRLIDVGYGVLFQEASDLARSTTPSLNISVGAATPMYSAPERFTQEFLQEGVGRRADVFSFGKLLYQVLTWESPSTVKPVHRKVPALTEAWDDFIFRCVSERPTERFSDAREALAAYQELPISVTPLTATDRTDTRVRRSIGKFRSLVEIALADRVLTSEERSYLHAKAEQMGIAPEDAERVIEEMMPSSPAFVAPVPAPVEAVTPPVGEVQVACRRCSQPNLVPAGSDTNYFACSACGANLGFVQDRCPRCGCIIRPRRTRQVSGCAFVLMIIVMSIGMVGSFDRGGSAYAGALALGLAIVWLFPKRRIWSCMACRAEYDDPVTPGSRPVQGTGSVGCLVAMLIIAALIGVMMFAGGTIRF